MFHTTLLFLGLTSVSHHSRLDRWWIQDWKRTVDNIAVVCTGLSGFLFLRQELLSLWLKLQTYGLLIFTLIAKDVFDYRHVPVVHSTTHIALLLFLICYDTNASFI